jgi:CBS domain-containing protein
MVDIAEGTFKFGKTTEETVSERASLAPNLLNDFLKITKVRDAIPDRSVLAIPDTQIIGNCLKLLSSSAMRCAVVSTLNETPPRALFIVDAFDLAMTVLDAIGWTNNLADERVADMINAAREFLNRELSLVKLVSQKEPVNARISETSLFEVAALMTNGIHRVLITENGMVTNILSQSDIARVAVNRMDLLAPRARQRIDDTFLVTRPAETVKASETVVNALHLMRLRNVPGLPVVDDNGKLIASFSSTDILGITEDTFYTLALKIPDFLMKFYGFIKPPVVCLGTDTVENLLFKFVVYGIHRVFIVDENMVPKGVVTLTDVMKWLTI